MLAVLVGVERVHEDEGDVDVVGAVEELDLTDGQVEERHAVADLNDRLGANAAHGGTETTVELEDSELAQELDRLVVGKAVVVNNLLGLGRGDLLPVNLVALGLVVQVAAEQGKEVVHLSLETGLLVLVSDGVGKVVQSIAHLRSGDGGGSVFEGHVALSLAVVTVLRALSLEVGRDGGLGSSHCECVAEV